PVADVDAQHDATILVTWDRLAGNDTAESVDVDPALVEAVVQGAVAASVLGGQRQLDQRGDRPIRTQCRVGQLEQRVGPRGQTLVERFTEPREVPQRGGRAGVVHTDHRSPWL